MKRTVRRLFIFLALVIIGAVVFFPYNQYAGDLKTAIEREARSRGIVLEIESMNFGFPNHISAAGIAALLPQGRFPIPLWINNIEITPSIWPLFSRKVYATLGGKAYSGDLAGILDWNAAGGAGTVKLSAQNLNLEEHPLFRTYSARGHGAFSFESGLNLVAAVDQAVLLQPVGAKFDLTIEDGAIAENKSLGPLLVIPEISDFNLQTKLEQQDQTINIRNFRLDSSIGKADATGTIHLTGRGAFDNARVTASFQLTEDGWRAWGPQLLAFSGIQKQQPQYSWTAAIDLKAGGLPNIKLVPG